MQCLGRSLMLNKSFFLVYNHDVALGAAFYRERLTSSIAIVAALVTTAFPCGVVNGSCLHSNAVESAACMVLRRQRDTQRPECGADRWGSPVKVGTWASLRWYRATQCVHSRKIYLHTHWLKAAALNDDRASINCGKHSIFLKVRIFTRGPMLFLYVSNRLNVTNYIIY